MSRRKVLVIVPRLPPSIDGVGDYSFKLTTGLSGDMQFDFLVCDPKWNGPDFLESFKILKLKQRSSSELLKYLKQYETVFLHYVGYGYARRGCPFWLVQGLVIWRKNKNFKLISFFHELYAFGSILTSQFWTSAFQQLIFRKLANVSDVIFTSKNNYSLKIKNVLRDSNKLVTTIPVFSNVGELAQTDFINFENRKKCLVIFGGKGVRTRAYTRSLEKIQYAIKQLGITEVIDIGPAITVVPSDILGVPITVMGEKSSYEISSILCSVRYGFIDYPTEYLCKSGVFASYCAHGLVTISSFYENQLEDGVIQNKHYVPIKDSGFSFNEELFEEISKNSFDWYQEHNLHTHFEKISKVL